MTEQDRTNLINNILGSFKVIIINFIIKRQSTVISKKGNFISCKNAILNTEKELVKLLVFLPLSPDCDI